MILSNKGFRFFILCAAGVAFYANAFAQAVGRLDSTHLESGNTMILHLQVPGSEPAKADFSVWDSLIARKNILSATPWRQENGQWLQDVTFVAFDSARIELPPLPIQRKDGSTVFTGSLTLLVSPTPVRQTELYEIKDIHRSPLYWLDYWPIYALILLFLLSGAVWWWLKHKRRTVKTVQRMAAMLPHELALRKIDALHARQLWQQGQVKEYYSELTFIAREYLEKRYPVPALESTSDELYQLLSKTDFPEHLRPTLREVLQWADLAKFAKGEPPAEFHENALRKMRALVQETVPALSPAGMNY